MSTASTRCRRASPSPSPWSSSNAAALYSFGGVTGVVSPDAIIAADRAADEYGIDTMSAGVTIAFAMELFERGILTVEDTGGLDLSFGNHESMVQMVRM